MSCGGGGGGGGGGGEEDEGMFSLETRKLCFFFFPIVLCSNARTPVLLCSTKMLLKIGKKIDGLL